MTPSDPLHLSWGDDEPDGSQLGAPTDKPVLELVRSSAIPGVSDTGYCLSPEAAELLEDCLAKHRENLLTGSASQADGDRVDVISMIHVQRAVSTLEVGARGGGLSNTLLALGGACLGGAVTFAFQGFANAATGREDALRACALFVVGFLILALAERARVH